MKPFPRLTRDEEERATAIHLEAFVIDGLTVSSHSRQQFSKMIQGGVNAANWTIAEPEHDFRQCIHDITSWYSLLRSNEDKTTFVVTARDILQAKKEKKVGIIFGLQNAKPIGDEIGILQVLHRLGLRIIQLTYNERNFIGDGAGEKTDCGLSSFGERVVEEMNRLGILIDLSHCGSRTSIEAIELSKDPVVFSHAGTRRLCNSPRNKGDEELKSIAEKGGLVGANAWGPVIWRKERQQPTIDDFLNHIDYLVRLIGVDHVGIGLDLSEDTGSQLSGAGEAEWEVYKAKYPQIIPPWLTVEMEYAAELKSHLQVPNITRGLVCRGYSDKEIRGILGANFLRIFEKVWKQ